MASINESLSGVSTELDKILTQLRSIKQVQDEIGKGASEVGGATVGNHGPSKASKPVSQSSGVFSTPPRSPGSQLTGITPTATGGGPGGPGGRGPAPVAPTPPQPPGGSRLRNAALLGTAAVATAGYNLTPGIQDVIPFQSIKFGASILSAGGYNQNYYGQVRAMFGGHQSNPYGAMAAANIATMSGQGMGTGNFSTVMRETSTTSLIFGMSNLNTAAGLSNMTSGTMAGRLAQYGIYVSDFETGNSRGFGNLIDQIWRVHYGSSTRKVPYESVAGSIRGGWLGVFINKVFADDPNLREMVIKALLMKAQAQGSRLDYKSLGRYGQDGATQMNGPSGTRSAIDFSVSQGNTPENNPLIVQNRAEGSRADLMEASQENTIEGWRASTYMAVNINELTQAITENGGPIIDFLYNLKGALQGFQSNGETNTVLQILGGLLGGGGIRSILPFSSGGDVMGRAGTTTSDSIPARLSKGEYVINARAAQILGKDFLDSINSTGHSLGSGFASPAKNFATGGDAGGKKTIGGFPVLESGSSDLQTFTAGGKSVTLSKKYGHLLAKVMDEYAKDPVLSPIVEVGGYSYRKAYNPNSGQYSGNWSKHAGGVAIDLNWTDWGMPPGRDIKPAEKSAIEKILANNPSIKWGGYWTGSSRDAMHFEVSSPTSTGEGTTPSETDKTPPEQKRYDPGTIIAGNALMLSSGQQPSVSGFGSFTGGSKGLSLGLGSSFSWISAPLFSSISGGITSSGEATQDSLSSKPSTGAGEESAAPTASPGAGSGPEWLYRYLVSKGLRGNTLKKAWVIGMRESSGDPNLQSKDKYGGDWNSSGSPYYDVGLYQINNRHLPKVKERYGGDMRQMLDLEKNWDMTTYMSNNWNNLLAWALESDGQTFNWSYYDPYPSWAGASMANHRRLWGEYDKYNTEGYSEGAYSTHEGMAKLHEGEMVLPANVAEQFRKAMREPNNLNAKPQPNINITLHIDKASDEEAERFARKVKSYLNEHDWFDTVRSR